MVKEAWPPTIENLSLREVVNALLDATGGEYEGAYKVLNALDRHEWYDSKVVLRKGGVLITPVNIGGEWSSLQRVEDD